MFKIKYGLFGRDYIRFLYFLLRTYPNYNKNDNIHKNDDQNIGFGIPINFPSQRKKIIQIGPQTTKLDCCGQDSHLGKVQYRILNPH